MEIQEIAKSLGADLLVCKQPNLNINTFYAGDFLSRVMGKAPIDCAWFTIMSNVNVAGVAVLADVKVIVLCEGVTPDANLVNRCKEEGIALLKTELPVFESCRAVQIK